MQEDKPFHPLWAISPLDGRYQTNSSVLSDYFSELALIRYRVRVEVEYFLALVFLPLPQLSGILNERQVAQLREIYLDFHLEDGEEIKRLEKTTNHDVKAVEYFLKDRLETLGLGNFKEFIHFGLTSQDINNTAIPLLFKEALEEVYLPSLESLIQQIEGLGDSWKEVPMLAYTHGQAASPTRLGKELMVFVERLKGQKNLLELLPHSAKFGGATGNFNAHQVAYPNLDWISFADHFIGNTFGLKRSRYTTQIDNYDHLAAQLDNLKRINTIFIDFSRDIWQYISKHYFGQKIVAGEIGSSAMPHKVNPIDFENAEGNLGLANALFEYLSAKLPVSRLQRDLTDSTVLRNLGVPVAHSFIAFKSLIKGLNKLVLNPAILHKDLENHWIVLSEAIQTVLRREGYIEPYEILKDLTRNKSSIDQKALHEFIDHLSVSEQIKLELKSITPFNYIGI